jgi:hypothetical protein
MDTTSATATGSDPLKAVADAMDAAVEAAKEGADRAKGTLAAWMPATGDFLSRAVYRSSYAVSYGVVFPVAMVAHAIPKDNAIVNGLVDGARAAMDAIEGMKTDRVPGPPREI